MSTSINDGGPAFPVESAAWQGHGMTLRDYFAAKAMYIAAQTLADALGSGEQLSDGVSISAVIAATAYEIADAMLAAREVQS